MSKINFTAEGRNYCLEFTRDTVKQMEARGFSPQRILDAPVTSVPELFHGAFLANHPLVTRKVSDKIFYGLKNRDSLVNNLIKMYNEPIQALTDDSEGNAETEWEMTE